MNDKQSPPPWTHPDFLENQRNFPGEELWQYAEQQVAWSWDGRQIVASAATLEELCEKLEALGIDWQRVVFDFIPDPDVSYF